jgi:cytochrome P450
MTNRASNTSPIISISPSDPSFYNDPYSGYRRIRSLGPIVHWADYGFPVTARYELVSALLRDRRFGRDVSYVVSPESLGWPQPADHVRSFYDFEKHSMLECEPPVHTRLRGLVNRAFVSRSIEQLRPEITNLCHRLIDGFIDIGVVDLLPSYATPVPVIVIAELLGLPAEDATMLLDWSHRMVAMYQFNQTRAVEDAAVVAAREFRDYIGMHIAATRRRPSENLMSRLIAASDDGKTLSHDELVATVILLMNAGHEATVHTIGNAVNAIFQAEQYRPISCDTSILPQQPDEWPALVEEALRYDPPLHLFTRYALQPLVLFGQHFEVGDQIGLLLAAANHDPEVYAEPERFNPKRYLAPGSGPQPMSFGAGIHFSVGAPLARLELEVALQVLFQRLPPLRLDQPAVYRDTYHFHGLANLFVRWDAHGA